ncbi:MAG: HAMP domain-containing sensor histidine kinase [Eubacteriales bacterium]|nr:HAMP domain-containing sensor histidine kinase [Eubacteriales bacterium]
MKGFGRYVSRHLALFLAFVCGLALCNVLIFGAVFRNVIFPGEDAASPAGLLEETAAACSREKITEEMAEKLREQEIWAMFLDETGTCVWNVELPEEIPMHFSIQEVAVFSKGYLADYPVFVWDAGDGLLVLGYPKDSYTKLLSNYYPISVVRRFPAYCTLMLAADLLAVFAAYTFSKRRILKNTEPVIGAIEGLAKGEPTALSIRGELSGVADSINRAGELLRGQQEARANWIRGVSHDIRTPLSMILGYAGRIAQNADAGEEVREQAVRIQRQSVRIRELVEDLNLVSKLEYDMQPLQKENVRAAKLLRSYAARLLNQGIPEGCAVELEVAPKMESRTLSCDARLLTRAISNLVQNSFRHNPQGCTVTLGLEGDERETVLFVADDGVGISEEKRRELEKKPHYLESMDEELNLRHGMGLLLVRKITEAHGGRMELESEQGKGCKVRLKFIKNIQNTQKRIANL